MKMRWISKALGALTFAVVAFGATASQAALFQSGAGAGTCVAFAAAVGGAGPCVTVAITPHPLWEPNGTGGSTATWVSYADTGFGGSVFQPHNHFNPIFSITETFLVGVTDLKLDFTVWADDTVEVFVDGISIFPPNFTQGICAGGVIGCEPLEGGIFSVILSGAGAHTLTFVAYQIGTGTDTSSNPFGVIYAGSITEVPEPATVAILGLGALLVGGAARRRARRAA